MIAVLDSSILVAALVEGEQHHIACGALLDRPGMHIHAHALAETFSTLTGGRLGYRVLPESALELLEQSVLAYVEVVTLTAKEMTMGLKAAPARGVRGAAIYDYLHLVAARKAKARRLYTLDVANFRSFQRAGDPEIVAPIQ
jgi:predicted nucleic acid-binding protein